jgi:predicted nucleotidyltransferase
VEAQDRQWEVAEAALLDAVDATIAVIRDQPWGVMFMGGIASAIHGRPRWTHDIDLFVRPEHARLLLEALAKAGFETSEEDPYWLFKAWRDGVLVDVIFRSHGDIYLDDEMQSSAVEASFHGRRLPVIAPEDLLVIKALVHAEYSPRHWHDALALVSRCELDWDYVLRRARHGPRRVLSLLLYAQSNDLPVPFPVVDELYRRITAS